MNDKAVLIVATFTAKPGKADALKKILSQAIPPSRAEDGCLFYELYRSVEDGNVFLFYEKWKNAQSIEEHQQQAHFRTLIDLSAPLLSAPPQVEKI